MKPYIRAINVLSALALVAVPTLFSAIAAVGGAFVFPLLLLPLAPVAIAILRNLAAHRRRQFALVVNEPIHPKGKPERSGYEPYRMCH